MDIEFLEDIGLTKSEIKVYLSLLELGSTTTGPIVEHSRTSSSKIYEILERLSQKGLVSMVIKSGTKYFEAADPHRLLDYLQEKKNRLEAQTKRARKLIPELELKQSLSKEKSEVLVFKGMEGARTAFEDLLKLRRGDEITIMGFSDVDDAFKRFIINWHHRRSRKGIRARAIFGPQLQDLLNLTRLPFTKVKAYPLEKESPVAILTYADKTLYSLPKDQIWIQVRNARLAQSNRLRFEDVWSQEIRVYRGFDAVTRKFTAMVDELPKGAEYQVLGATYGQHRKKLDRWFTTYHQHRVKQGVRARLLTIPSHYQSVLDKLTKTGDPAMKLSGLKYLPSEFSSPMQINLYPDHRVLMFLFGRDMSCFEIESKQVYDNFKTYFEGLWNQQTKTLRGLDAVQMLFEHMLEAGHCDFIGARGYFFDKRKRFITGWIKRAAASGFTMRNIVDRKTKGHLITRVPFAQTKYNIPKEFSPLSVFWIFGGKVVISNWTKKEPVLTVIENKQLHDLYKKQFETMWTHKLVLEK